MKRKVFLKAFAALIIPIFAFIALKIIDNVLGDGIPLFEYCIVCSIIIILMGVFYVSIAIVITKIDDVLDHRYNETSYSSSEKCKYGEYVCCAKLALESIQGDYDLILDRSIANQYNLFTEEEIIKKESSFSKGEIWIFSYDLTTEVLGDIASDTVKRNLSKGIVYREFYIADNPGTFGNSEFNRKRMENWYETARIQNGENCLKFYPYNNPNSMLNYIFALFGIVLYIEDVENTDTIQAYFSLRSTNSRVKKPIYVKMPHCMTNKYYRILYSIINNHNTNKEKEQ